MLLSMMTWAAPVPGISPLRPVQDKVCHDAQRQHVCTQSYLTSCGITSVRIGIGGLYLATSWGAPAQCVSTTMRLALTWGMHTHTHPHTHTRTRAMQCMQMAKGEKACDSPPLSAHRHFAVDGAERGWLVTGLCGAMHTHTHIHTPSLQL